MSNPLLKEHVCTAMSVRTKTDAPVNQAQREGELPGTLGYGNEGYLKSYGQCVQLGGFL